MSWQIECVRCHPKLLGLKYSLIAAGGETQERDSRRILSRHLYLSLIPDTSIRLFIALASNLEVGDKYFWD